jgi:AcrR family transcriptional regulator
MTRPTYRRLDVDERRRRLLARGAELFEHYSYDELSMARIAREAGISKALLYHYFPSKQAYFAATLEQAAGELAAAVEPDASLEPVEQLTRSLDAYLAWVEGHADAYAKLMRSVGAVAEVREIVDRVRRETADRIVRGIAPGDPSPSLRAAVRGWLWFMDGVLEDWLEHRDLDRDALRSLLLGTLLGAVTAAGSSLGVPGGAGERQRRH